MKKIIKKFTKDSKLDAYLVTSIMLPHPNTKKNMVFNEDTAIKVNPSTGEAYIGPYTALLYKIDYSLVI